MSLSAASNHSFYSSFQTSLMVKIKDFKQILSSVENVSACNISICNHIDNFFFLISDRFGCSYTCNQLTYQALYKLYIPI